MTNFTIDAKTIASEVKYAVKAIRKENKGLPNKPQILTHEILYLPQVDHMALRVHYIDGYGVSQYFGIAI